MTINIFISDSIGGSSLADTSDIGSVNPDSSTDFQDLFISHDAQVSSITDCAVYIYRYTGSNYLGDDADVDLTELLDWGTAGTGGVKLVMDGWDGWVSGAENSAGTWLNIANGYGDVNAPIPLVKESIVVGTIPSSDEEIPVDGVAHLQIKVEVPASVPRGAGYRAFGLTMAYSATS